MGHKELVDFLLVHDHKIGDEQEEIHATTNKEIGFLQECQPTKMAVFEAESDW